MPRLCVRCGKAQPADDSYLCRDCGLSWVTHREIATAIQADPARPRLWLKRNGWRGGWPAKDAPVHV